MSDKAYFVVEGHDGNDWHPGNVGDVFYHETFESAFESMESLHEISEFDFERMRIEEVSEDELPEGWRLA